MNTWVPHRRRAGFTLVELLVASALMSIVLIAAYASLHAGLEARRIVEPRGDAFQTARVALALLSADLRAACPLDEESRQLIEMAIDRLGLSARAYTRILKVARTIADLEGAPALRSSHVAEAIQYRSLDRRLI